MSDPASPTAPPSPPSVNLIGEPAPPAAPDPSAKEERKWFLNLKSVDRETVNVWGLIVDIGLRTAMSVLFMWMAWWWLCKVADIVNNQTAEGRTHLSDTVLVALLTTTTINVLGLLYFVANYLFPKQGSIAQVASITTPSAPQPPSTSNH